MYLFYLDECGNPSLTEKALAKDPWFVLAAVGFEDRYWPIIDDTLAEIKCRFFPDIDPERIEIKSMKMRSWGSKYPRWPYNMLSKKEMDAFAEEVYRVFDIISPTIFSVAINKREHKDKYTAMGKTPRHPYEYCFECIVERIDWFLDEQEGQFGFLFLDELKGRERRIRSLQLWYQKRGTWTKEKMKHVKEVPFFASSKYSGVLALPDLCAYNVYHCKRYNKPNYPFFVRIRPYFYYRWGKLKGYGIKQLP